MDFTEIQRKLSCLGEDSDEPELSFAQVLSLPIEFLAFVVKNRREASLLLKISESSANLDLVSQNYNMFASRAQALQEAWNGLWRAQEPYLVPAIPLIGLEMTSVNSGQTILLEKMGKEFYTLKKLGEEVCHYVDVNHSLAEELQMEGIDRLAVNKLLLAEVEKELVRRINHICSNKSVRELSSMRQFLCQLKSPSGNVQSGMDEGKDCGNSTINGSCSTEKVTTDDSSEARPKVIDVDKDLVSPDSQSFASKCVDTPKGNIHMPSITTPIIKLPSEKLDYEHSPSDKNEISRKISHSETVALAGITDSKLECRHLSSSASEERLPKAGQLRHDEGPYAPTVAILENKENSSIREDNQSEDVAVYVSRQPDVKTNEAFLRADLPARSNEGSPGLESTQEQATLKSELGCDFDKLQMLRASSNGPCRSSDLDPIGPVTSNVLPVTQPGTQTENTGSKRKRQMGCTSGLPEESKDVIGRNWKSRTTVQASFESMSGALHSSAGAVPPKRRKLHFFEESSHSLCSFSLQDKGRGMECTPDLCSCSCALPNHEDAVGPSLVKNQDRCKHCRRRLTTQVHFQQGADDALGQVTESLIPATQ